MKSLDQRFPPLVASVLISSVALAAYPSDAWKRSLAFNNQAFDIAAKFALKDGKLTGSLETPMGVTSFTDGAYKDDTVDFTLNIEGGGGPMKIKYHGKLEGDTITGKIESPSFDGGAPTKFDWKAARVKEEKKPAAS